MAGLDERKIPTLDLDVTDSTCTEAMRRAVAGERGPLWITARCQSAGRGRSGRSWTTPQGNLAATLLLTPRCPPRALAGLSVVAGVAVYDAIAPFLIQPSGEVVPSLRLKWPNDVMVAGAKLSGTLIESSTLGADTVVAIGIGINVAAAPDVPGRAVTALAQHGTAPSPEALGCSLLGRLAAWIEVWDRGAGFPMIRQAWLERAGPPGEAVSVNTGNATVWGTFAGLDEDGALRIADARTGRVSRVTFGDVSIGSEPPANQGP